MENVVWLLETVGRHRSMSAHRSIDAAKAAADVAVPEPGARCIVNDWRETPTLLERSVYTVTETLHQTITRVQVIV